MGDFRHGAGLHAQGGLPLLGCPRPRVLLELRAGELALHLGPNRAVRALADDTLPSQQEDACGVAAVDGHLQLQAPQRAVPAAEQTAHAASWAGRQALRVARIASPGSRGRTRCITSDVLEFREGRGVISVCRLLGVSLALGDGPRLKPATAAPRSTSASAGQLGRRTQAAPGRHGPPDGAGRAGRSCRCTRAHTGKRCSQQPGSRTDMEPRHSPQSLCWGGAGGPGPPQLPTPQPAPSWAAQKPPERLGNRPAEDRGLAGGPAGPARSMAVAAALCGSTGAGRRTAPAGTVTAEVTTLPSTLTKPAMHAGLSASQGPLRVALTSCAAARQAGSRS